MSVCPFGLVILVCLVSLVSPGALGSLVIIVIIASPPIQPWHFSRPGQSFIMVGLSSEAVLVRLSRLARLVKLIDPGSLASVSILCKIVIIFSLANQIILVSRVNLGSPAILVTISILSRRENIAPVGKLRSSPYRD